MVKHIQKAPWIVLLLLTVVVCFPPAQELGIEEIWPEEPNLPVQEGDDRMRAISTYEMRQALWYVEMYGLARETLFEKEAIIVEQDKLVQEAVDVAQGQRERKRFWRTVAIGGTIIGVSTGVAIGALFVQ